MSKASDKDWYDGLRRRYALELAIHLMAARQSLEGNLLDLAPEMEEHLRDG